MKAVNTLGDFCEDRGVSFDALRLEPLKIRRFVDAEGPGIQRALEMNVDVFEQEEVDSVREEVESLFAHYTQTPY